MRLNRLALHPGLEFVQHRSARYPIRCRQPARVRVTRPFVELEAAGVEFIDENGGGPGVRLRKRQQKKR